MHFPKWRTPILSGAAGFINRHRRLPRAERTKPSQEASAMVPRQNPFSASCSGQVRVFQAL